MKKKMLAGVLAVACLFTLVFAVPSAGAADCYYTPSGSGWYSYSSPDPNCGGGTGRYWNQTYTSSQVGCSSSITFTDFDGCL